MSRDWRIRAQFKQNYGEHWDYWGENAEVKSVGLGFKRRYWQIRLINMSRNIVIFIVWLKGLAFFIVEFRVEIRRQIYRYVCVVCLVPIQVLRAITKIVWIQLIFIASQVCKIRLNNS